MTPDSPLPAWVITLLREQVREWRYMADARWFFGLLPVFHRRKREALRWCANDLELLFPEIHGQRRTR